MITESTPGVVGGPEDYDAFGTATWLSTEVAADAGAPTYLFIGAPGESIGKVLGAGAAYQLRYDRSGATAVVSGTGARFWSQASKGVLGGPETGDRFGSSFQSFTSHGQGAPKYLVGVPGESIGRRSETGVVTVLGGRRSFDNSVGGPDRPRRGSANGYFFGTTLGAARNIDDNLPHDPFPATALGQWSADLLISSQFDTVSVGLPAGTFTTPGRYVFDLMCPVTCEFGLRITASGGG